MQAKKDYMEKSDHNDYVLPKYKWVHEIKNEKRAPQVSPLLAEWLRKQAEANG